MKSPPSCPAWGPRRRGAERSDQGLPSRFAGVARVIGEIRNATVCEGLWGSAWLVLYRPEHFWHYYCRSSERPEKIWLVIFFNCFYRRKVRK